MFFITYQVVAEARPPATRAAPAARAQARALVCYWSVRELGMTAAAVARRIGMTAAGVYAAVNRGERLAAERSLTIDA